MHNSWISSDFVLRKCTELMSENSHVVFAAGEHMRIYSNYKEIDVALLDFYSSPKKSAEMSIAYIIYIDVRTKNEILNLYSSEKKSFDDFFITQCEANTWILYSEIKNIGVSFCLNKAEDQWGSPIIEQLRWHIATHLMHNLEKIGKYCLHSSAVVREGWTTAIFGDTKAGKSTQVARAMSNGWKLISDDRVVFSLNGDAVNVEPFWKSLKLRGDVMHFAEIERLFNTPHTIISKYGEGKHGTSKRMVFQTLLSEFGGQLQQCVFLSNDLKIRHNGVFRLMFINNSLITFGGYDENEIASKRANIARLFRAINDLPFVIIPKTKFFDKERG